MIDTACEIKIFSPQAKYVLIGRVPTLSLVSSPGRRDYSLVNLRKYSGSVSCRPS